MKIERVEASLLQVPLDRPIVAAITTGSRGGAAETILMPIVRLVTDEGLVGEGWAWCIGAGGRAMLSVLQDDLAPRLEGEDPLDHERLWQSLYWQTQGIGRHGLVIQAVSAIDLALWDLKGKAAGQPLYKLLGGTRTSAPIYGSDGGWLNMSAAEVIAAGEAYLAQGMRGIKLKVGHDDPRIDVERVSEVRRALGDDTWIAVDANQKWDYPTALRMGREFEQLGCVWYEEPMICEDVVGHARLSDKLDIPIALGETLGSHYEIDAFLRADAVDIVQPDITRVGGITEFLKIIASANAAGRIVEPHLMMETSLHLACAFTNVVGLEYMPWLTKAFANPPEIKDGEMCVPDTPGLGVQLSDEALQRFKVV